jgi:SAM-dependent methyltransferase
MATSGAGHWDDVYRRKGARDVSWYQPSLRVSLDLIGRIGLPPSSAVIDVGGGASTLVDDLLDRGFRDLTVLDLSQVALDGARERLGAKADAVRWIAGDVTEVALPPSRFDLWHDRAVFHFLVDPDARARYVRAALGALRPGGHILVATFGLEGPTRCSGLDVVRYSPETLHAEFGARFEPVLHVEEVHRTPTGVEQEFVYCYCRRAG